MEAPTKEKRHIVSILNTGSHFDFMCPHCYYIEGGYQKHKNECRNCHARFEDDQRTWDDIN